MTQASPERDRAGSPGMEDNRSRQSMGGGGGNSGSGRNNQLQQDSEEVFTIPSSSQWRSNGQDLNQLTYFLLSSYLPITGRLCIAATSGAWILGIHSTHRSYASLVLGSLSTPGKRLSGIFENCTPPAQSVYPSEHGRHSTPKPIVCHWSWARFWFHRRRTALRTRRLQCLIMAIYRLKHTRSPLVLTHSRTNSDATISHDSGINIKCVSNADDGF